MGYVAPAGGSVNFAGTGAAYAAPAGDFVDFYLAAIFNASGGIHLSGSAEFRLPDPILSVANRLGLSGTFLLHTEIGRRLRVNSRLALAGSADIVAAASMSITGPVLLRGPIRALHGPALLANGQLKLHGSPRFKVGPGMSAGFKLRFSGAASFKRGARLTIASHIPLGVLAQSTHAPEIILQVASGIKLRGRVRVRYRG